MAPKKKKEDEVVPPIFQLVFVVLGVAILGTVLFSLNPYMQPSLKKTGRIDIPYHQLKSAVTRQ